MPFWYNDPTGDNKYAVLNRTDWAGVNASLHFDEIVFKDSEDFYYCYAFASSVTDIKKSGSGSDWKFEPQHINFKIAKRNYEKQDYKTKKNVSIAQSKAEKLFCKLVETYDLTKIYSGFIVLQDSGIIDMLISGNDAGGKPIATETFNSLANSFLNLEIVSSPTLIVLDDIKIPNKNGNYTAKSAQLESEKLNDRLKFVLAQCQGAVPDVELKDLVDIAAFLIHENENQKALRVIWNCCTDLMK